MVASSTRLLSDPDLGPARRTCTAAVVLAISLLFLWSPAPALAGAASPGELFFYPCTSCHPVALIPGTDKPSRALPNEFKGHDVVLTGHDQLGRENDACLACHDEAGKNPGMLKTADGSLVDINGDVSLVCYRCHSARYKEWQAGVHGKSEPKCTASGCHDPHTPGFIFAGALPPFTGSGFQFQILAERRAFAPLMAPAPSPAVETPSWLFVVAALGLVPVGGQVYRFVRGRLKR